LDLFGWLAKLIEKLPMALTDWTHFHLWSTLGQTGPARGMGD